MSQSFHRKSYQVKKQINAKRTVFSLACYAIASSEVFCEGKNSPDLFSTRSLHGELTTFPQQQRPGLKLKNQAGQEVAILRRHCKFWTKLIRLCPL